MNTHQIPRKIPAQNCLANPVPSSFMGGVLPFGCIYIQLFYILNSLWLEQHSYNNRYIVTFCPITGLARCTTCLDSSSSHLLSSWWCVQKVASYYATSTSAGRTTAGGGALFLPVGPRPFTCCVSQSITSSLKQISADHSATSSTLVIRSSSAYSSSSSQASKHCVIPLVEHCQRTNFLCVQEPWASLLASGLYGKSTPLSLLHCQD